jgi:plastocyanin
MWRGRYASVVAGSAIAAAALSGCRVTGGTTDMVNGKKQFVDQCGRCHTLARAGTTGTVGPNLDEAFARSREDGMPSSTFEGVVERQILNPNINNQVDPANEKPLPPMPAKLVTGQDARDVAAYVGQSVAEPGKDSGKLATVGVQKAQGTAKESNGTLDIPVADAGLAFKFANAQANTGQVSIVAKNPQPTGHNIAVEGNGVDEKGPVVQGGADSKISVNLKPGSYTFYCSVPGHREGGMVGKLTVK